MTIHKVISRLKESSAPNGALPPGWTYVGDEDDALNPWGYKKFVSMYSRRMGGNGKPACDLTITWHDDGYYVPFHGSVGMKVRCHTPAEAAAIAEQYYKDTYED